jgi:hypothetical protein
MTTKAIGNKIIPSNLSFTKARQLPNHLFLLSNPLLSERIEVLSLCDDGNLKNPFTSSSSFTFKNTTDYAVSINQTNKKDKKYVKKYDQKIKTLDSGYIIPLNVDDKISELHNKIKNYKKKISNYPMQNYYKINDTKNNFIYQLIDNELFVLCIVIKNFFNNNTFHMNQYIELFHKITFDLTYIVNNKNFQHIILSSKTNSRNSQTIYGGCTTMQAHFNYSLPSQDEKYCRVTKVIEKYMQVHSINFTDINIDNIFNYFKTNKDFFMDVDLGKTHFSKVLGSNNLYDFYLYLENCLFPLIISLESFIANLIKINFPELYDNFNIDLPGIETKLQFFKSFAINFSIPGKADQLNTLRQGATDPHKDNVDCLNAFCAIVVFGEFEGGDLVLSEIGITIEIKGGYIVLLRSALLEHFNLLIIGNRFAIVYYLRKYFYNEI